jgi:hypothetical protein
MVAAVEGALRTAGHEPSTISASAGDHSGELASLSELGEALTEAIWRDAWSVSVSIYTTGSESPSLSVTLREPVNPWRSRPVLEVLYWSGTVATREVVRNLVERLLPSERPDPRRHWRWLGPTIGLLYWGTALLLGSRIPRIHGLHVHASTVARAVLIGVGGILAVWPVCFWVRLLLNRWFPVLERLPDTGETRWSNARVWVGVAIGAWVAIVIGLLALPPR